MKPEVFLLFCFALTCLTLQSVILLFPVYMLNVPAGHLCGADELPEQL